MDASRRQTGLVNVGGSRDDVGRLVVLVVVLVVAAIIKPWGAGPAEPPARNSAFAASPGSPEPPPSPVLPDPSLGPDQIACLHGLELVSLIHLGTFNVREWLPITRTGATGPDDPGLGFARVEGGTVRAVGVCNEEGQAADDTDARHPVIASAWRLAGSGSSPAKSINLIELKPDTGAPPELLPHIYQPIERQWSRTWRPGRYALEVVLGDGTARETVWIGVDVRESGDAASSKPSSVPTS